jgi:hypothetical protein
MPRDHWHWGIFEMFMPRQVNAGSPITMNCRLLLHSGGFIIAVMWDLKISSKFGILFGDTKSAYFPWTEIGLNLFSSCIQMTLIQITVSCSTLKVAVREKDK